MKHKIAHRMPRFLNLSVTVLFVFSVSTLAQERFARYQKINAYEVRPGVLMLPRYSSAGEVCELGLQRLHYSPALIRLNFDLSREEIFQILNELIPVSERGKLLKHSDEVTQSGPTFKTTKTEYENVEIRVYATPLPPRSEKGSTMNSIVATVMWKQRKCL